MSGVYGHLVRRGVQAVAAQSPEDEYIEHLKEQAGELGIVLKEIQPVEWLTLFFTAVAFALLYASVKYTLGEVVSSLAMIEQPGTTAILLTSDHPDAPLEKEAQEIQIETVKEKPITASIRKTIAHITTIGGTAARWRGLVVSVVYHMAHALTAHFIDILSTPFFQGGPLQFFIPSIVASVLLSCFHMTWTHAMISMPSELPWYKRIPRGTFNWKALALPSLVFAVSQYLVVILPSLVFLSFGGLPDVQTVNTHWETSRIVATLASALLVSVALLLPAAVTLTRIEASLMPDDQETIVKFDRSLGGAAISAINLGSFSIRKLFLGAWRSFDRASRVRLVKFYTKMFMIQIFITLAFFVMLSAEMASFGPDRFITLIKAISARAQLEAMGITVA